MTKMLLRGIFFKVILQTLSKFVEVHLGLLRCQDVKVEFRDLGHSNRKPPLMQSAAVHTQHTFMCQRSGTW